MNKRHILVVDDEVGIQRILQRVLSGLGCTVITASDTISARRQLKLHSFDLVLCDYLMPGENGLSFLQGLKSSHPKILRVMITGNGDMGTVIEAINQAQVHYFMTKPFEFDSIQAIVAELLRWTERQAVSGERPFTARQHAELANLRNQYPGIDDVQRQPDGAILLDEDVEEFAKGLPELLNFQPKTKPTSDRADSILLDEDFHHRLEG